MISIIQTGGKQYLVKSGDVIKVEKLPGAVGDKIIFDKVLLTSTGADAKVGKPFIDGATVTGTILAQGKGKKIRVFKYKAKSKYRRTQGHRQQLTEIKIIKI